MKDKNYILRTNKEKMNAALAIAKENDFPLSKAINDFIDKFIDNYNTNGFKEQVAVNVKIEKYKRKSKQ